MVSSSSPERKWCDCTQRRYALAVLCLPDFEFVQDGCRRDDRFRLEQHAWTVEQLARLRLPTLQVSGPAEQRLQQVLGHLKGSTTDLSSPPT